MCGKELDIMGGNEINPSIADTDIIITSIMRENYLSNKSYDNQSIQHLLYSTFMLLGIVWAAAG